MINNKIEMVGLYAGAVTTVFFEDLVLKVIASTVAMVIGTTAAFFWKRYLLSKYKK